MKKEKKALPVGHGKLRRWIGINGLSLVAFSKEIGITRPYLSMVMKGTRRPSKLIIMKIRELTNGEVKYLGDILDRKKKKFISFSVS